MSDLSDQVYSKVSSQIDPLKTILTYIPGFKGYIERQSRRDADKIIRDTVANRFEEQWQRVSAIQKDLISQGQITYVDDLESAAIQLRTFIDRVRRASRGYSGLFDAVKINEAELASLYQYDAAMLGLSDDVARAIDHVEASIGSDGLPAAIRNLVGTSRQCQIVFEKREEVVKSVAST